MGATEFEKPLDHDLDELNSNIGTLSDAVDTKATIATCGLATSTHSVVITFTDTVDYILAVRGSNANRSAFALCRGTTTGGQAIELNKGSSITLTTGNGKMTVANSEASGASVYMIILVGVGKYTIA